MNLVLKRITGPSYITRQPSQVYHRPIKSSFGLIASEKIYREWSYSDNSCCCADSYHTILTDIRLLNRYEEYICCVDCSEPSRTDSSIFLSDIDQMRECRGEQPTFGFLLCVTLTCTWPCYILRRIFCPKPKCLEVFGVFGSDLVRFKQEDISMAQIDLSTAITNSKQVTRR